MKTQPQATPIRTLLISDVHLGGKHSQTEQCLDFLKSYLPDQIYLVGDFIDGWKCDQRWHWSQQCNEIVEHLEAMMRRGTEVYYVPGNHDSFLRNQPTLAMIPGKFTEVRFANEFVFESVLGYRFLITHGDLFDVVEKQAQWVSKIASFAYDSVLSLNRSVNRMIGLGHKNPYGACGTLKSMVKRVVRFISGYEAAIMRHAREQDCDGVICGHIHTPAIIRTEDMLYCNTGDWVENCTGIIELHDGSIRLESVYGSPRLLQLPPHRRLSRDPQTDNARNAEMAS